MVHFYGINPERINVVPEGVDTKWFRPLADASSLTAFRERVFGTDSPFILYVGKPTERRNLSPLIRAFGLLKSQKGIPHKLLIIGTDLPGTSPFRRIVTELGLSEEVFTLGYVTHEEMPLAYNAADLFIYPSSYEGFGMPVLEAMACGTPVVTLNNTAFPEFAGGVAHLLKNADVETLKSGIYDVLTDEEWRKKMSREGPRRAAAYDWELITKRYLELMIPLTCSNGGLNR